MTTGRRDRRRDTIGSLGDMEYLAASGLWVPVSGPKTVGYSPVIQADGTIAFAAATAGGGYTFWDRDKPPTSAHANDEEGTGTAGAVPSGWTAFNSPGGSTLFEVDGKGRIHQFIPSGSGDVLRFWYKTVSGSWTITTKLQTHHNSNYNSSGLCIRDPVTTKMLVLGLQSRSVWPNYPTLIWTWWTNSTTWAGETLGPGFIDPTYLQLSWDNSTSLLTARISMDGINPFKIWQTSNTWFTGGAPTQVGIQCNSQSGGDCHAYYEFWRFKAATTDTIGGSRTL